MKYIDADRLRAEVTKERKSIEGLFIEGDNNFYDGQDDAYNHVLALIDSLQQEQPEVDLEKDFSKAWAIHPIPKEFIQDILEKRGSLEFIYKTAHHFYELGKNSK